MFYRIVSLSEREMDMTFKLTIKSAVPTIELITASTIEGAQKKAAWLVNAMYNNSKKIPAWTLEPQ